MTAPLFTFLILIGAISLIAFRVARRFLSSNTSEHKREVIVISILVLLATLPFLGGVGGEFVEDDLLIIRDNVQIRSISHIPELFTQSYWHENAKGGLYRPLTVSSYALDGLIWGRDEIGRPSGAGIQFGNLLLNLLIVLLLYFFLHQSFGRILFAGLTAAFFAVHPVHIESVVHMVGRADLLMTFFFILAFVLHTSRAKGAVWLAPLCYLLSLLSKEMAVTLPLLLFVYALIFACKTPLTGFLWAQVKSLFPYAAVLVVYLIIRGIVLGAYMDPPRQFSLYVPGQYIAFLNPAPFETVLTMSHALAEYVRLFFIPLGLGADYSGFPHAVSLTPAVIFSLLVLSALILTALFAWKRDESGALFWLCWFFVSILPVSNLLFVSGVIMAERVVYLVSISACAILGLVSERLCKWRKILFVVPLGLLLLFLFISAERSKTWLSAREVFEDAVGHPYSGSIALNGLCREYIKELDSEPALLETALALAEKSVRLNPQTLNISQLAFLLEKKGDLLGSLNWWNRLRQAKPERKEYYDNSKRLLGILHRDFLEKGAFEQAIRMADLGREYAKAAGDSEEVKKWSEQLSSDCMVWLKRSEDDKTDRARACQVIRMVEPGEELLSLCTAKG